MDFLKYAQLVFILQIFVVAFFGIGLLSLLFLGIRIRFFQKALNKWINEGKRLSKDPVLDQIIKLFKAYKEKGFEIINTGAIIKANYYKQKIFFIPIYYWEQFISKSEILTLFFGLLASFVLIWREMDNCFFPIILGTGFFIILVSLETILALQERRKMIFIRLEDYLDNSYLLNLQKIPVESEFLRKEKIEPLYIYNKEPVEETKNELKDKEIEWIIKQFYGEEKRV